MLISSRKLKYSLLIVSLFYIVAFILLDQYSVLNKISRLNIFDYLVLIGLFLLSIFLRYVRWFYLLIFQGAKNDFYYGFLRYSAGFLYTATPGKVGELSRVYFYKNTNVGSLNILSSFIIERAFDLIVVLLLSIFMLLSNSSFLYVIISVLFIILILCLGCSIEHRIHSIIKRKNTVVTYVLNVINFIKRNINLRVIFISLFIGLIAWSITSFILIYIMYSLGFGQDISVSMISVYPISMLVGALTFIPGGIGTTETTIAYTLNQFNIDMTDAFLIAILARFSTIWFATIWGLFCSWVLSFQRIVD